MSNEKSVYVGVYLEIQVNRREVARGVLRCAGGHETFSGRYCQQCGAPLEPVREMAYPTMIDDLLPQGSPLVEDLAVITPAVMLGEGTMLAIGNNSQRGSGEWFRFDFWCDAPAAKALPSPNRIDDMADDFGNNYADVIAALEASPLVSEVAIRFGIVILEEY